MTHTAIRIAAGNLDKPAPTKTALLKEIRAARRACIAAPPAACDSIADVASSLGIKVYSVGSPEIEVTLGYAGVSIVVKHDSSPKLLVQYYFEALDKAPAFLSQLGVGPYEGYEQYDNVPK